MDVLRAGPKPRKRRVFRPIPRRGARLRRQNHGGNVAGAETWLGRERGRGGDVAGTCGRGRRPRRPAPGAGRPVVRPGAWGRAGARDARPYQRRGPHAPRPTRVGGVGGAGTARGTRGLPAWHRAISLRNARVPAPRHEVLQDEISLRNNLKTCRVARRVRHVRPSPSKIGIRAERR